MKAEPKVTKEQALSWCPKPRGDQEPGNHAEIPAMHYENASSQGKDAENRELGQHIIETFNKYKPGDRFVLQWRMFPNASNPANDRPDSCGCGCSCGCG